MRKKTGAGGTVRFEGSSIRLLKAGRLKIAHGEKMRPSGRILRATVSRTQGGEYYVSFTCTDVLCETLPETGSVTGIDMGIKALCCSLTAA